MPFKKYPDIERLGHEDNQDILNYGEDTLVIEEKVDGGNFSIWLEEDGLIHFGSRNRDLTIGNDDKIFARLQIQLREHLSNLENEGIKLNPDYIYYLECMQPHTIKYNNPPNFIGFDIRMKRDINSSEDFGLFLGRDMRVQEFIRLKIPSVPLIWRGSVKEFKKIEVNSLIGESKIENWNGRLEL